MAPGRDNIERVSVVSRVVGVLQDSIVVCEKDSHNGRV